jgi:transcription elongation factor SPT6
MIVATELGRDPLLRKEIRSWFKTAGLVSVLPTERGISKIDDHHRYYVGHFGQSFLICEVY